MLCIYGWNSRISEELRRLLPEKETAVRGDLNEAPPEALRYLFAVGVLYPKRLKDQTEAERAESWRVNCEAVVRLCDDILAHNPAARICVIGSESAYRGSFDGGYARAKRHLHRYIEEKRIGPRQQLVGVSPGIIADAGMTLRRADKDNLAERRDAHPMKRFLTAMEVGKMAHHLLYEQPYVSGTVVRMHGGDS